MLRGDRTPIRRAKENNRSSRRLANHPSKIEVADYRYKGEKRFNVPDAGLAIYNYRPQEPVKYNYDPHLDPQLIWTGKTERTSFEVETVSLHIHERVSTQAILKTVQKAEQYQQLRLFAEPDLPLDKRIDFYRQEMDWTNRLILGDSLLVMNSLKEREFMEGKVQMIYVDPPYGINYASNFQPHISDRNVKDKDEDLTREPEQIKAYRDTWQLGIHSWLAYLRDRLLLCGDLLSESGSIFVQINDENLHLARCVLDEVFGRENFVRVICFAKTGGLESSYLKTVFDYILWYARDINKMKYKPIFKIKRLLERGATKYTKIILPDGTLRPATRQELLEGKPSDGVGEFCTDDNLTSQGNPVFEFEWHGKRYSAPWKTTPSGLSRLGSAGRLYEAKGSLRYLRLFKDFIATQLTNSWDDVGGIQSRSQPKVYTVQTATKAIERCMLMTTEPGDLVLDPTCGSGTTAYCAEKWGRRWITCDTSRVALTIGRARLMTAKFDYYELLNPDIGPSAGFKCDAVSHLELEDIANNTDIDQISDKYHPQIKDRLSDLNQTLKKKWKEWEVPRIADARWTKKQKECHDRFWESKNQMKSEIDESIRRSAKQELLYDLPEIDDTKIRVSGPFSVEAIPIPAAHQQITAVTGENVSGRYADLTIELLRRSGITFPAGKQMTLENLRPIASASFIHAEGEATQNGGKVRVAVSLGSRYGPVTAKQVDEAIRSSYKMGFDVLVFAGFAFEPEAQATIQKNPIPKLSVHMAHISPDVIVGAYSDRPLLKTTKSSQLFTVFGEPDVLLEKLKDEFKVRLLGVDLYDPTTGEVSSSDANEVPAWFLDEDYDSYTFRICQAFFPREARAKNPWDKLENALRSVVDKERMDAFRGAESLPFRAGEQKQIAVKVIDVRGNEVMVVKSLNDEATT
jgi:adenine-specific DNA-methyltransferase